VSRTAADVRVNTKTDRLANHRLFFYGFLNLYLKFAKKFAKMRILSVRKVRIVVAISGRL